MIVATNQDVLLFKLLTFWGVLLTETCYKPRRATACDFTVPAYFPTLLTLNTGENKKLTDEYVPFASVSISTFFLKSYPGGPPPTEI